jgi:hypothetical protein
VAAPHYKMVHSQKVDEKVKQMVSQFQWVPPTCTSLSSLFKAVYSSHFCIVLCNCSLARKNPSPISVLSFHPSDFYGIMLHGQDFHRLIVLLHYWCHTSFSAEHEFSMLHLLLWEYLAAPSYF